MNKKEKRKWLRQLRSYGHSEKECKRIYLSFVKHITETYAILGRQYTEGK